MPLKPAVSTLARNTIKTAYNELDRTINPGDKRDFPNTTLQNVQDAALKIENQLAARQSLRNMRRLMPLFHGLEHYAKVVDVLCNGTPFLPWIWAPITLILRVASEHVESFETIIKGYASIAEPLKRFEILGNAFINTPDFQQTLAVFYADILTFHKYAYKFVHRSGWALMFSTSWGRFQRRFDNILEDLNRHGTLIDLEANARNISEAKSMRDDIRKWKEESEKKIDQQELEHNASQYDSIVSWLKVNETDQLTIIDSISSEATDYQGNCAWILKNKKIVSWADSKPDSPVIWLKGSAGTGKSVLCTQLVNFLKATKLVAYHFCSYLYESSISYEQILKSIILQIVKKDKDLVANVYASLMKSMSNETNQVSYVWLVIDGLDECDEDKQKYLIRLLNQLTSTSVGSKSATCKVLIAGRGPSDSLQKLKRKQVVSLNAEKALLNATIKQYVGQRLKAMDTKFRQLDMEPSEIEEIQRTIVNKADACKGMFLYARLVVDYLASNVFFSGDEMKESVNQLPQELAEFYQRILSQILSRLDPRSVDRIRCVLGWIAFAKRPLKKTELLSAVTFSSGDIQVSRLAPQYILDICGTLVEENRDTTLTFIHSSVKEFLRTTSKQIVITRNQALQEHGIASVTCLLSALETFGSQYPQQERLLRVAKGLYGLHVYATEFWTEYLLSCADTVDKTREASSATLIRLACQLTDELERLNPTGTETSATVEPYDKRLATLQKYGILWRHLDRALKARSQKNLEFKVSQSQEKEGIDGCQFPSRFSPRTLRAHMNKYHASSLTPKPIRSRVLNSGKIEPGHVPRAYTNTSTEWERWSEEYKDFYFTNSMYDFVEISKRAGVRTAPYEYSLGRAINTSSNTTRGGNRVCTEAINGSRKPFWQFTRTASSAKANVISSPAVKSSTTATDCDTTGSNATATATATGTATATADDNSTRRKRWSQVSAIRTPKHASKPR
ncbi:nacht domain-containing [Fusarium longipes]|uniref:Nacht domain-containing n=1 Tax=Fusarium longipes TaxID=694270 RepID=A0A395S9J5_9HYPO|nr:nacht domain-containing [Fusarium longipes]